jgi:hypothetical protein
MPCGHCKNRRFGGKYRLHYQGEKNRRSRNNVRSNWQLKQALNFYRSEGPYGCMVNIMWPVINLFNVIIFNILL